jgi:catechol 2,3-dioxygenase-like lactoylglutathione lyase family enzyme
MDRRAFIAIGLAAVAAGRATAQEAAPPLATRIKMTTTAGPDLKKIEAWYTEWLGLKVRERGKVSAAAAKSWGAPKAAGRSYVLMSSDGSPDVFLRAVENDAVPGYAPMTTWGWNSWEIIVDDIEKVNATMKASPFRIVGGPAPLKSTRSIVAMQVRGPADEILYLTCETGDREKSILPVPKTLIDRPFILVVAGPEIEKLRDWYADTFRMAKGPINNTVVEIIAEAQGMPLDTPRPLTLLRMRERGNMLELDGYVGGKGARPRPPGQLPPGNAMASFAVASLDTIKVPFIAPPAKLPGAAYNGRRSATLLGVAGEPVELIEE